MKNDFLNAQKAKSGVSLVVVLLFMMIATIAATATYKWITSESRSSGSRMLQREAYQSAVAGIENARSWIAWNANDAGALVKQYLDGGKVPVNIDRQLRPLQRAGQKYSVWLTGVNTESSTYKLKILSEGSARNGEAKHSEIAILNVDGLYQVKIPSKRESSIDFKEAFFGGASSGISLDVSSSIINGDTKFNTKVSSTDKMIVTGDLNVNSNTTRINNLYVNGNLYSCTNLNVSKDTYVKEKLYVNGTMEFDGSLYVEKGIDFSGKGADGNAQCNTGYGADFHVKGNMTSNGDVIAPQHTSANDYVVDGNFVVNQALLKFPTYSEFSDVGSIPYKFNVKGNVFLGNGINSEGWHIGYESAARFVLGTSQKKVYSGTPLYRVTDANSQIASSYTHWTNNYVYTASTNPGSLYYRTKYGTNATYSGLASNTFCNSAYCAPTYDFSNAYFWSNAAFYWEYWLNNIPVGCSPDWTWVNGKQESRWKCSISSSLIKREEVFVKVDGDYVTTMPDTSGWGANRLQEYAESIDDTPDGNCKGSHVKDPIQFNKNLLSDQNLHSSSKQGACTGSAMSKNGASLWNIGNSISRWGLLEKCYDAAKNSDELYDGEWLLIELDGSGNQLQNFGGETLSKNYIIILDNYGTFTLPPTTADARVIIYLKQGGSLAITSVAEHRNYFIFSEGDMEYNAQSTSDSPAITGSMFLSNCHNIKSVNTISATYNSDLTDALAGAAILCNNDKTGTCSSNGNSGGSSTGSSSSSVNYGGTDPHYISMAPQLGVSLETQYENKEKVTTSGDTTRLAGSYIVLPRVIYLPSDPAGKLEDYYNVLGLNGASVKKSDVRVTSCASSDASLNVSGALYSAATGSLSQGVYTCNTSASDYEDVPFWVVIGSETGNAPTVYFQKSSQEIAATQSAPMDSINLVVPAHTSDITINYSWSGSESSLSGWNINNLGGCSFGSGKCSMTLSAAEESIVTLFTVTTSGASGGTFVVYLDAGSGYQIGAPSMSEIHIQSGITVVRKGLSTEQIKAYCESNASVCPDEDVGDWPKGNCESGSAEWVKIASGVACSPVTRNEQWNCIVGGTGTVSLEKGSDKSGCIVVIPQENNSYQLESMDAENSPYTLFAGIFAKKQTLTVGFTGDLGGKNPKINVRIERSSSGTKDSYCDYGNSSDHTCKIDVFYGDYVTLSLDTSSNDHDNFNYWKCENASGNCPTDILSSTTFPAFAVQESEYTLMAHFGESDKHCFFDEFTHPDILCGAASADDEYCIAGYGSGNSKAKWLFVSGAITSLALENGYLSVPKSARNSPVVIMSSVNAGLYGTMKALVQVTRETSSHDKSENEIRKSGILLRATKNASEYLMLNVYANKNGNLEATYCIADKCESKEFLGGYSTVSVASNAMVMVEAKLKQGAGESVDSLVVTAYKASYYGSPTGYSTAFALSGDAYLRLSTREHEYVGFSLASEKVRLYGIGWKSEDYASECHDTYPTLKCSFSAVAEDGFVPTEKSVKPWVGHSGWYRSKNCSENYLYQGADACGGNENSRTSCGDSYTFRASGAGAHGYMDGTNWVKTAFATLRCYGETETESLWNSDEANCGKFWTGKFTECTNHEVLLESVLEISSGAESGEVFSSARNLRNARLKVKVDSVSNGTPDLEIYFASKDDGGNLYYSQSVRVLRYGLSDFDIVSEMVANADAGFDPENVTGVYYRNNGIAVRIASLSTECANAISLSACRATYKSGTTWEIEANVSNTDKIESFTMTRTVDGSSNSRTVKCNTGDSESCLFDGDVAMLAFADDRSPYQSEQGKSYAFHLSLVGNGGSSTLEKDCSVSPETIGKIAATCSIKSSSVRAGEGLPMFTMNIDGCPDGGCAWKISSDNGKISETGTKSSYYSSFSGENTATNPWDVGTYLIRVESANPEYPFDGCSQEFTVTEARSSSSSEPESSSSSAEAGKSSSSGEGSLSVTCGITSHHWEIYTGEPYESIEFYFLVKNNVSEGSTYPVEIYKDSKFLSSASVNSYANWTAPSLGKLSKGSHSYSIRYNGQEICASSIQIVSALSCSVDKTEIGFGDSFTLTTAYSGSCWNSSLSGNGVPYANCGSSYTITPTSMGTQTYVYQITNGSVGVAACTTAVAVTEIAPTVECPDAQTKSVGSTVSVSPKTLTGCGTDNGCSYTVSDVNSQVGSGSIKNGGKFSFTGSSSTGTVNYTLNVSNSKGSAECNFDVEYVENAGIEIANNSWEFTVPSGSTICFSEHPVQYDWQSQAHISCVSGNCETCKSSIDGNYSGNGWSNFTLTVDLDSKKTYTGCHVVAREDEQDVKCTFGW